MHQQTKMTCLKGIFLQCYNNEEGPTTEEIKDGYINANGGDANIGYDIEIALDQLEDDGMIEEVESLDNPDEEVWAITLAGKTILWASVLDGMLSATLYQQDKGISADVEKLMKQAFQTVTSMEGGSTVIVANDLEDAVEKIKKMLSKDN